MSAIARTLSRLRVSQHEIFAQVLIGASQSRCCNKKPGREEGRV
jgi:hypothetical protein